MANSGNYSKDNELAKEFSALIGNIATEVTNQVAKNTVLKDVKELQTVSNQMQISAPRILQTLKQANQELTKTKKASVDVLTEFNAEVQKSQKLTQKAMENFYAAINTTVDSNQKTVADSIKKITTTVESSVKTVNQETDKTLAKFTSLFEEQNAQLKENLEAVDEKYNQLSTGSYQAYRDAMDSQTKEIVEPLHQQLEYSIRMIEYNNKQLIEQIDSKHEVILNSTSETTNQVLKQLQVNNDKTIKGIQSILKEQKMLKEQNIALKEELQKQILLSAELAERHYNRLFFFLVLILLVIVGMRVWDMYFV